jgi:hypothetical protein
MTTATVDPAALESLQLIAFERIEAVVFPVLARMDEECADHFLVAWADHHDLDPEQLFGRYTASVESATIVPLRCGAERARS